MMQRASKRTDDVVNVATRPVVIVVEPKALTLLNMCVRVCVCVYVRECVCVWCVWMCM